MTSPSESVRQAYEAALARREASEAKTDRLRELSRQRDEIAGNVLTRPQPTPDVEEPATSPTVWDAIATGR